MEASRRGRKGEDNNSKEGQKYGQQPVSHMESGEVALEDGKKECRDEALEGSDVHLTSLTSSSCCASRSALGICRAFPFPLLCAIHSSF